MSAPGNGRFADVITTEAELRAIVARPNRWIMSKVKPKLDEDCIRFIARSPFVVLASTGPSGHLDLSPKGDPAGFAQVLDDKTLVLPDQPGNRRIDSFRNILGNPNVGLIFFVPGEGETLRVGGQAIIARTGDGGHGGARVFSLRQVHPALQAVGQPRAVGAAAGANQRLATDVHG